MMAIFIVLCALGISLMAFVVALWVLSNRDACPHCPDTTACPCEP